MKRRRLTRQETRLRFESLSADEKSFLRSLVCLARYEPEMFKKVVIAQSRYFGLPQIDVRAFVAAAKRVQKRIA